jgi:uncharacterized protein (DUF305 family)
MRGVAHHEAAVDGDVHSGKVVKTGEAADIDALALRVEHAQAVEVNELTETQRGAGGFGSTGTGHQPM